MDAKQKQLVVEASGYWPNNHILAVSPAFQRYLPYHWNAGLVFEGEAFMDPRESFVFYRSFYEAIKGLPVESHDRILSAIIEYAIYGTEIELSGIEKMAFTLAKPSLDSSRKNMKTELKVVGPKKPKINRRKNRIINQMKNRGF